MRGLPEILIDGIRESHHSELTWKLISKFASVSEDEKATLRRELAAARDQIENWRSRAEDRAGIIIDLKARWDSVSKLSNVQSLLYVIGGVLLGPFFQDLVVRRWVSESVTYAAVGAVAVIAAFLLGRIGPRREA